MPKGPEKSEPDAAEAKKNAPHTPRRVVSMERICALAEPKRKKPWKVGLGWLG